MVGIILKWRNKDDKGTVGIWTSKAFEHISHFLILLFNECTCFTGCVMWSWSCCLLPSNTSLSKEKAGLYTGSFFNKQLNYCVTHISFQILFAALHSVCILIDGMKLVNDIWMIPCQYELHFQLYTYFILGSTGLLHDTKHHDTSKKNLVAHQRKCLQCLFLILVWQNFL